MSDGPIWISEADVVSALDLTQAIDALEAGLRLQARGGAHNMSKTHVGWQGGTLHAIGAVYEESGIVGAKTWAHIEAGGATPLLILWNAGTGALLAVIEAFALGQLRTGGISGVATRLLAGEHAAVLAMIGTGKQALAQVAAVAAVRKLQAVRIWGRDAAKRSRFVEAVARLGYDFRIETPASIAAAAEGAHIVTLATRAREPIFDSAMAARGAHINAIGAITLEREEFAPGLLARAQVVCADDPVAARKLSREFGAYFGGDAAPWERVKALCDLVGGGPRPPEADLTVFKAMGMGVSDLALGAEILRKARAEGFGRPIAHPQRIAPRLGRTA